MLLHVLTCYSCGEQHGDILLKEFSKPNPPWTHWYCCPQSGDPVPLLVTLKGDVPLEWPRKVIGDLERAMVSGRFLSAIFYLNEKKGISLNWVTQDFPHADYEVCQKLLADECAKHGGLPAPVEPLPRAQKFDASKLFPGLAKSVVDGAEVHEQAESGK